MEVLAWANAHATQKMQEDEAPRIPCHHEKLEGYMREGNEAGACLLVPKRVDGAKIMGVWEGK